MKPSPELLVEVAVLNERMQVRRALFDRILLAVGDWDEIALDYLAGELESGGIGPPPPPVMATTCNGEGTCHGEATHCQLCGDVTDVCDQDDCPHHGRDETDEPEAASEDEED